MNPKLKIGAYVASLVGTLLFGSLFFRAWHRAEDASSTNGSMTRSAPAKSSKASKPAKGGATNALVVAASGSEGGATNLASTNRPAVPPTASGGGTNEGTNAEEASAEPSPEKESIPTQQGSGVSGRGFADLVTWGLLAVVSVVVLGILVAYDVSHFVGQRAAKALFEDDPGEIPENLYEQVEKAYGAGDFLESVRLLREYAKENPRAAHAQIRIAEIYEKDLNNPLAAALEYEEVMLLPLGAERRGWTGIHLVNLYNRLEKPDQAIAMMQKIIAECPDTPAALKARERLESAGIEIQEPPQQESASGKGKGGGGAGAASGGSDSGAGGLPPGFRPR